MGKSAIHRLMARQPGVRRGGALRKLVIAIGIVLGVAIVLLAIEVTIALSTKPVPSFDYAQEIHEATLEHHRTRHGDGPSQWPQFDALLDLVEQGTMHLEQQTQALPQDPDNPYPYVGFDLILGPREDPYREDTAATGAYFLAARQRAIRALEHWRSLNVFDRSADLPNWVRVACPPVPWSMSNAPVPQLGASRQLARAMAARMRLAAEQGDHVERLAALEEGLALARVTSGMGPILGWLTGTAIQGLVLSELLNGLYLFPVEDDAWLVAADALIARELFEFALPPDVLLTNRHLNQRDEIQRTFTEGGRFVPRAHLTNHYVFDPSKAPDHLAPFGDSAWSNIHGRIYLGRGAVEAWFERARTLAINAAETTGEAAAGADAELARHVSRADWRNPMGESILDPLSIVSIERRRRIEAAGARVMLAIERYRTRNEGEVPASLDDVGELLPRSVRVDPFTLQPWVYEPTPSAVGWSQRPLGEHEETWPYTLRSRPMPTKPPPASRPVDNAWDGMLITTPMYLPDYAVR